MGWLADGLPAWVDEPAGIPRIATGVPNRLGQLMGLGNAIVPAVAAEILRGYRLADEATVAANLAA